jgi:hypothetical protein
LGGLSRVDVVVEFLDGTSTTRANVDANQTLVIDASSSTPSAPVITSFSPGSGAAGSEVTILGSFFAGATRVAFNGINSDDFSVNNDGRITATVPLQATSGRILVRTPNGSGQSVRDFIVLPNRLTLLAPNGGGEFIVGTSTQISWSSAGNINNVVLEYTVDSGDSWIVIRASTTNDGAFNWTIPDSPSGEVLVRVRDVSDADVFDVSDSFLAIVSQPVAPVIASFAPESSEVGDEVTIFGSGFAGTSSVTFGRANASVFAVNSDDQITVSVPDDAVSGKITVTTPYGSGESPTDFFVLPNRLTLLTPNGGEHFSVGVSVRISWISVGRIMNVALEYSPDGGSSWDTIRSSTSNDGAFDWTVPNSPSRSVLVRVRDVSDASVFDASNSPFSIVSPPVIASFSPDSGKVGKIVTILGSNFSSATRVSFGGAGAIFAVDSDSKITANVPDLAASGKITVTSPDGTGESAEDFTMIFGDDDVLIEAETMNLSGFAIEERTDTMFSGDVIRIPGTSGTATTTFTAPTARCRVLLRLVDEDDGISNIKLNIDKMPVADFDLDKQPDALTTLELSPDLDIRRGADIEIFGVRDGGEFVRIDYIRFIHLGPSTHFLPGITSFSPASAPAGAMVAISGHFFTGATSVTFAGIEANFTVTSANEITATVPNEAASGKIRIVTPEGEDTTAVDFVVIPSSVSVDDPEESLPTEFSLSQNYPNPFNPATTIKFTLPGLSDVELKIYNIRGELVRTLGNDTRPAGEYTILWDGRDDQNRAVISGIYLCRFRAGTFVSSLKMTAIK